MADDPLPLASLSLTHVYYNPEDPVSYLCAWLALVPQALCIVYATLIWSTREAEVALMFAGQLACEVVNFALKRLIKEERPRHIHVSGGKGYGMPSSHAQFASFWAVALGLFLLGRHRPRRRPPTATNTATTTNLQATGAPGSSRTSGDAAAAASAAASAAAALPSPPPPRTGKRPTTQMILAAANAAALSVERYTHQPWSPLERVLASAAALVLAALVAWSRIYLGYHTVPQVLIGCAAGLLSAVGWFAVTGLARGAGWLAYALELPVARWIRLRDLVVEEDLCQAGWEKWLALKEVSAGAAGEGRLSDSADMDGSVWLKRGKVKVK